MNNDVQDVIRQADLLIKERKYKSAWNLLLPYKSDPAARKRLAWLDQKRQRASQEVKKVTTEPNSQQRSRLYILITVVVILVVSGAVIYGLSQQKPAPTQVVESTSVAAASTPSVSVTPPAIPSATATATPIPPTEDLKEVSLQQRLRDWLTDVSGVSQVLSFDVDIPGDEPPLAYVEVMVEQGYNDTHIPDKIVQKLNDELKTKQYSDFSIIMSDGSTTTEYAFDSKSSSWNQTVLAFTAVPAD